MLLRLQLSDLLLLVGLGCHLLLLKSCHLCLLRCDRGLHGPRALKAVLSLERERLVHERRERLGRVAPARRGLAISGLFDLAPLVHCEWLMPDIRLTPESIRRLSPAGWAAG